MHPTLMKEKYQRNIFHYYLLSATFCVPACRKYFYCGRGAAGLGWVVVTPRHRGKNFNWASQPRTFAPALLSLLSPGCQHQQSCSAEMKCMCWPGPRVQVRSDRAWVNIARPPPAQVQAPTSPAEQSQGYFINS